MSSTYRVSIFFHLHPGVYIRNESKANTTLRVIIHDKKFLATFIIAPERIQQPGTIEESSFI